MTWETAKLGDVCSIEKGNIGIMKAIPGEYPLVVLGKERRTHNEFQFDDEAVVIPLVSSTGHGHRSMNRIFFQTGKFSIGSILCAVIPNDKTQLSAEFLYRYLDFNKERELVGRMRGMANVTLPMKEIAEVEIPLPPLEIQKELIYAFQKIESGKGQISTELDHQLALVKELRKAYLREAMQGKLVPQDPTDEPSEILLEKIRAEKDKLVAEKRITPDKPLPGIESEEIPIEIPSNWTWCRLGDLFEIVRGSSPRPKGDPRYFSKERTSNRWIKISDITSLSQKGVLLDTVESLTDEGTKYSRFVCHNDIIIAASGSVGKPSLLGIEGYIYDGLMAIRNISNSTLRQYLFNLFRVFESELLGKASGATWQNINTDILRMQLIPLPPLAEQERIVAKLEKLMKFCDELEANIKQGITHADRLLQTALREALVPKQIVGEKLL